MRQNAKERAPCGDFLLDFRSSSGVGCLVSVTIHSSSLIYPAEILFQFGFSLIPLDGQAKAVPLSWVHMHPASTLIYLLSLALRAPEMDMKALFNQTVTIK